MLAHTTLAMVRRYVELLPDDLAEMRCEASLPDRRALPGQQSLGSRQLV